METGVKIIFTVFAIAVAIAISFVRPSSNNAGPDWLWLLGRRDPVRSLLFRDDGSLRRYTKVGTLLWFAMFLAILWLMF